jgi:chemotaxis protein MotB
MARKKKHPEHANHERWLISYADFITLLFAFFVVMFAVSQVDSKKVGRFQDSFSLAVGISTNERGYLPRMEADAAPLAASMLPIEDLPELEGGKTKGEGEADEPPKFPQQLAELERDLEERRSLEEQLAGLKVLRRGNDLVLRLDATALFDSGDDNLRDGAMDMLVAIADEVRDRPVDLRVEGHTDDQPIKTLRFRSNWDLSTARATTVLVGLKERGRLDPKRLAAVGYAEFHPIGDNKTAEGRQMNRRVDFVVSVTNAEVSRPDVPTSPSPTGVKTDSDGASKQPETKTLSRPVNAVAGAR